MVRLLIYYVVFAFVFGLIVLTLFMTLTCHSKVELYMILLNLCTIYKVFISQCPPKKRLAKVNPSTTVKITL